MLNKIPVIIVLVLFASSLDVFLLRVGLLPGSSPALVLLPILFIFNISAFKFENLRNIFDSYVFKFLLGVIFISIFLSNSPFNDTKVLLETFQMQIVSVLIYFFSFYFFSRVNFKIELYVLGFAFLILAGSVWYDFFIGLPKPNTYLEQSLRKGGFAENANYSASGIKFLGLCLIFLLRKYRIPLLILILILVSSVLLTLSRSGLLGVGIILLGSLLFNWQSSLKINPVKLLFNFVKMVSFFLVGIVFLGILAGFIKNALPEYSQGEAGERLNILSGSESENSFVIEARNDLSRLLLFDKFMEKFMEKPFGRGSAYTRNRNLNELNTHNQFLMYAVDLGIFGLFAYLLLLFKLFTKSFQLRNVYFLIFSSILIIEGLFTHNLFYERALLVSIAFFESKIFEVLKTPQEESKISEI